VRNTASIESTPTFSCDSRCVVPRPTSKQQPLSASCHQSAGAEALDLGRWSARAEQRDLELLRLRSNWCDEKEDRPDVVSMQDHMPPPSYG
jgi:hypothetical protein